MLGNHQALDYVDGFFSGDETRIGAVIYLRDSSNHSEIRSGERVGGSFKDLI